MARRPPAAVASPFKSLTLAEMEAGVLRLQKRLDELGAFNVDAMTDERPPELTALGKSITRSLEKTFGEGTADFNRFSSAGTLTWWPGYISLDGSRTPLGEYREGSRRHIEMATSLLNQAVASLQEDMSEMVGIDAVSTAEPARMAGGDKIFIVHGHDDGTKETVARFIEKMGFQPIILHTEANAGRTLNAKFLEVSKEAGFAVVLMTPDDVGGPQDGNQQPRARQNVIFELGYFIGLLGPHRVAAIVKGAIEKPSDFDAVVYIAFDRNWTLELARELAAAGYDVDYNKVMRG